MINERDSSPANLLASKMLDVTSGSIKGFPQFEDPKRKTKYVINSSTMPDEVDTMITD